MMPKIISCSCGSCPVVETTSTGAYRAGCPNENCVFFGMFTLTDPERDFVLSQWNALVTSRDDGSEGDEPV